MKRNETVSNNWQFIIYWQLIITSNWHISKRAFKLKTVNWEKESKRRMITAHYLDDLQSRHISDY